MSKKNETKAVAVVKNTRIVKGNRQQQKPAPCMPAFGN